MVAWRDAGDWIVRTPRLLVDGEEFSIVARGGLAFQSDHTRPLIDLAAVVMHAKVDAAKLFWPVNTMSETVVHWLDRGLVAGDVTGHALARGDLDHWPFLDNSGRFEAQAWLKGLELDYLADWPSGKGLDATATFINNGMLASASNGTALQIGVDHADATIDSFHDARLLLDITAHGKGEAMLSYLRKLVKYGLSFKEVMDRLTANNKQVGGQYLNIGVEQYLVRGLGLVNNAADIGTIVVSIICSAMKRRAAMACWSGRAN